MRQGGTRRKGKAQDKLANEIINSPAGLALQSQASSQSKTGAAANQMVRDDLTNP